MPKRKRKKSVLLWSSKSEYDKTGFKCFDLGTQLRSRMGWCKISRNVWTWLRLLQCFLTFSKYGKKSDYYIISTFKLNNYPWLSDIRTVKCLKNHAAIDSIWAIVAFQTCIHYNLIIFSKTYFTLLDNYLIKFKQTFLTDFASPHEIKFAP